MQQTTEQKVTKQKTIRPKGIIQQANSAFHNPLNTVHSKLRWLCLFHLVRTILSFLLFCLPVNCKQFLTVYAAMRLLTSYVMRSKHTAAFFNLLSGPNKFLSQLIYFLENTDPYPNGLAGVLQQPVHHKQETEYVSMNV